MEDQVEDGVRVAPEIGHVAFVQAQGEALANRHLTVRRKLAG